MNKIYTNKHNNIYEIDKSIDIYEYSIDESSEVIINLNKEKVSVNYHFSIYNINDNTFKLTINHLKKDTISNVYIHGINSKDKKLIFDINGIVNKNTSGCICNEENIIINIKDGNSVIKPNLLINNFDIESSHSAFIGSFKEDDLFYLSRLGIDRKKGIDILTKSLLLNGGDEKEEVVKNFLGGCNG